MPQNYPIFPTPGINEASFDRLSGNLPPLQAQGNLT
jgi:hypothetical protein